MASMGQDTNVRALIWVLVASASVLLVVADWSLPMTYVYDPPQHLTPRPPPQYQFSFFLQDRLSPSENQTSFPVTLAVMATAQNETLKNQTWFDTNTFNFFGTVVVFDFSMTSKFSSDSTEVGRARGIYVYDLQSEERDKLGVELLFTTIFNEESGFGNSTLCLKGWQRYYFDKTASQLAICGGTGVFTLARGYADIDIESVASDKTLVVFKVTPYLYFW